MKKSITLTGLLLFTAASALAAPISPEDALLRIQDNPILPPATRGMESPKLKFTQRAFNGEAALYVFDNSEKGFMVLSADDAVTPLLGFSDTNIFDPANIPPAMQAWLDQYAEQIEHARTLGTTVSTLASTRATLPTSWTPIEPLLKTVWNQGTPFNNLCPASGSTRCYTGCVATSMAQVMNYFQYPEVGTGIIKYNCESLNNRPLELDLSTIPFQWDDMLDNYNGRYTAQQATAVAQLMQAAGYSVNMSYTTNSSGAISSYIPGALVKYFNYDMGVTYVSRSMKDYTTWATLIYNNLKNIGPVIYDGDTAYKGGHSFVCDGYRGDGYFHFNWGWGGTADGYFLLDSLNPSTIGIGGAAGGFNFRQDIVLGIQKPKAGSQRQDQIVVSGSVEGYNSSSYLYLKIYGNQYPGFRYYGLTDMTFDIGLQVVPANNSAAPTYITAANNTNLKKWWQPLDAGHIMLCDGTTAYPFPMFQMSKLGLTDGVKYKMTAAYRPEGGDWTICEAGSGDSNFFYITKSGSKYTYENFPQEQFTCDVLTLGSTLYYGNAVKLNIKLSNNTQNELTRGATLMLLDGDNEKAKVTFIGDSFVETLSPCQSISKEWTSELTSQLTAPIKKATEYYLALYDIDTETYYYISQTPVTMEVYPGNPTYTCSMTLDNATLNGDLYYFESSTDMKVTLTVDVTTGYFSYPIAVYIMEDAPNNQLKVDYTTNLDLTIIKEGESQVFNVDLNFPELDTSTLYYLGAVVNNSGVLAVPEIPFKVLANAHGDAGVEGIEADTDSVYRVYNLQGVKVLESTDSSDVKSLPKGIYVVNGKKVAL